MSPNQPKTPVSAFRLPDDVREALIAAAAQRGVTQTAVVVDALRKEFGLHPDKGSRKR